MNIRDILVEIIFIILMALSGVVVISRLWQDAVTAIGVLILILAFGSLLLLLILRIHKLEDELHARERNMRASLEDLGRQLIAKEDKTSQAIIEALDNMRTRMYR